MDYIARQMNQKEFRELRKLIKAKDAYLIKNKIPEFPPVFDNGDEVGVFFHTPTPHHVVGVILRDDEYGVTLKTKEGKTFHVSPFQLFHLAGRTSKALRVH